MKTINPIEAYSRASKGENIYFRYANRITHSDDWILTDDIFKASFSHIIDMYEFAVKPQPSLRPWQPEEVPVGAIIRIKNAPHIKRLITATNKDWIYPVSVGTKSDESPGYTYADLLTDCDYSLDYGKTWLPCGVVE